jgi:hypothetical protein
MNLNFLLTHRNRYLEGMDDRQKTPRGHPHFNSYIKSMCFGIPDGWTDGQTDGQMEILIQCGLPSLCSSRSVQVENVWIIVVFLQCTLIEKLPIFLINTLLLHIPLLALTDRRNDGQRNKYTCCAWAGGTIFQVVLLCQIFSSGGIKVLVLLTCLEYNTVVALCWSFCSGRK